MQRRVCVVLALALFFANPVIFHAEAQGPLPAVDIDCSPEAQISVYPGARLSGVLYCIISNPSTVQEEISIDVDSGSLISAHPGSITLGPNSDTEIQVALKAEEGMSVQTIGVDVEATVTSWNGLPPPTPASDSASSIASIMQYSRVTISIKEMDTEMIAGSDYDILITAGNDGNNADKMSVGITDNTRDRMESAGFQISYRMPMGEIESGGTSDFVIEVRAPKGGSEASYDVQFYVTSMYSCTYETSGCNTAYMQSEILVIESEDGAALELLGDNSIMIIGGISCSILVAAAVIVVFKRKRSNESLLEMDDDFEDDDFEDDDFEDDFEDDFFDDL